MIAALEREELQRAAERAHLRADDLHDAAELAHLEGDHDKADRLLRQAAAARLEAEALDAKADAIGGA